MTGVRGVWLGLSGVAAAACVAAGVPFWVAAGAFACAILPPLLGMFVQGPATSAEVAEVESGLWVALATLAAASTGGANSPLIILFAVAVGQAWASRDMRLTTEIAGFSILGYALAAIAGMGPGWVGAEAASVLAAAFGLCGLVMTGLLAAIAAAKTAPEVAALASAPAVAAPVVHAGGADETQKLLERAEARLRKAEEERQAAEARADAAHNSLEARTRFFAQTSHELRTPLNAIAGFADMMRNAVFGPLSPKYQEYAELIHEGGRNLEIVVDDVLDLSRIEAGRYDIHPEFVSLTDLAKEAVRFMSDMAARKKIELAVAPGEDADVFADVRAVRQIALNLISNALKFTPEGGEVSVSAIETAGGSVLAVSDTGVGISPDELVKLSRAFEQGEAGRRHKGAGLGLSVVRAFTDLHGGRLDIESREGGGSTIAVFFPAEGEGGLAENPAPSHA